MVNLFVIGLVLVGTLLGAFGSFFMKKGAKKFNLNIHAQLKNNNFIIGIAFFIISALVYMAALKLEKLSIVYPLTSFSYIWVIAIARIKLNEKLNHKKIIGIALIFIGIILVNLFRGA